MQKRLLFALAALYCLHGIPISQAGILGDRLPTKSHVMAARPPGRPATIFLWYANGTSQPEDGPYCTGLKPPAYHCTFGASLDECKRKVQTFLDRWYADFNVVFAFTRPSSGDYYTIIITSTNAWCSLNTTEAGVAPFNCNDNPGQTAFAFECGYDAHDCALLIAHEHAHMLGLDHTDSNSDAMYPTLIPTIDGFENRENRTPDALCSPKQNSYQRMLEILGAWPGGTRPSPFSESDADAGASPIDAAGLPDARRDSYTSGATAIPVIPFNPGDPIVSPIPSIADGGPPILSPRKAQTSGCSLQSKSFTPPPTALQKFTLLAICLSFLFRRCRTP